MTEYEQENTRILGWEINYAVKGTGPALFFLHGLGASWQWWTPQLDDFSISHRCYAFDLPGSGLSSPLTSRPDPEALTAFVQGLVDRFGDGRTQVVAHSLGAYVTLSAALGGLTGVDGIVAIAPAGVAPVANPWMKLIEKPLLGDILTATYTDWGSRLIVKSLFHDGRHADDRLMTWTRDAMRHRRNRTQFLFQLRLAKHIDSLLVQRIETPHTSVPRLLLCWGKHDRVFPVEAAELLQDLPVKETEIFERSGHLPQLEETTRFNQRVRAFLSG